MPRLLEGSNIIAIMRNVRRHRRPGRLSCSRAAQPEFRRGPQSRGTRLITWICATPLNRAAGSNPVSQVLQGEQRYDLVMRYQAPYRQRKRPSKIFGSSRPPGYLAELTELKLAMAPREDLREHWCAIKTASAATSAAR